MILRINKTDFGLKIEVCQGETGICKRNRIGMNFFGEGTKLAYCIANIKEADTTQTLLAKFKQTNKIIIIA